jgi:hypothetical protein
MMYIEGQIPSAGGPADTGPSSNLGPAIRIDKHTIHYPERNFTRFTKPFVIDLRGSSPGHISSPGSSHRMGSSRLEGQGHRFSDPVKLADRRLQMTPARPRPITIPTGLDSTLHTLRRIERDAFERENTQRWLKGLEQEFGRPGSPRSIGADLALASRPLSTGGFGRGTGPGDGPPSFSPVLRAAQDRLSGFSTKLEIPRLGGDRLGTDLQAPALRSGGFLGDLWGSGSSLHSPAGSPPASKSGFQPLRLFDAGSHRRLGLSAPTFGGSGGSSSTVPSLSASAGQSSGSLWNPGSSLSSVGPPSIRLGTSPSLTSGNWGNPFQLSAKPMAWQGAGGPSLAGFARGL